MNLKPFAALLGLGLAAPLAQAQVLSVYGTFSPAHLGNVQTGSVSTATGYTEQYTSFTASGFGGGVTLGALPIGPVRIGFDLRGATRPGTTGYDLAMAGLKVGIRVPFVPLKPYVQVSGGYLATRTVNVSTVYNSSTTAGGTFGNQYAAFEVLGGLDYHLAPFVDLRLVELGGGRGANIFGLSSSNGGQSASIFTVNTGVVVHF